MSLQSSLGTAVSGLRSSQLGIDLVARNIANADTDGYTRKVQRPVTQYSGGQAFGVRAGVIERDVDAFLQQQLRTEIGVGAQVDIRVQYATRLDELFGSPGGANSLDTLFNSLGQSFQSLIGSPDNSGSRERVINDANTIAFHLNRLSTEIQEMRQQTEIALSDAVNEANALLQQIAYVNGEIQAAFDSPVGTADLADQRDRYIDRLSTLLDIKTAEGERGALRVFTSSGNLLVDFEAADLLFDVRAGIDAHARYSLDESERAVGTLVMTSLGGAQLDLFRHGTINTGTIAAYRELRDETLVQAQAQLDELAHGLALALSSKTSEGTPVTVGAQNGFDVDVTGLLAGNEITLTYTETPPGTQQTVTFVGVDDAASLPLSDDFSANPNDRVIGIDLSSGLAGAIAAMNSALGINITAAFPTADTIRFLDDGAPNRITLQSASAVLISDSPQNGDLGLELFVDLDGPYKTYSNAPDGGGQKVGFAQRITVNQQVLADNGLLVKYTAATGIGDPARPQDLYERMVQRPFTFSPSSTGIGGAQTPLKTSVTTFAQRVINFQGQNAEVALRDQKAQTIVIDALQGRFDDDTKVDVDAELARLLELQNAYAANARTMSVIKELLDMLMRV